MKLSFSLESFATFAVLMTSVTGFCSTTPQTADKQSEYDLRPRSQAQEGPNAMYVERLNTWTRPNNGPGTSSGSNVGSNEAFQCGSTPQIARSVRGTKNLHNTSCGIDLARIMN